MKQFFDEMVDLLGECGYNEDEQRKDFFELIERTSPDLNDAIKFQNAIEFARNNPQHRMEFLLHIETSILMLSAAKHIINQTRTK